MNLNSAATRLLATSLSFASVPTTNAQLTELSPPGDMAHMRQMDVSSAHVRPAEPPLDQAKELSAINLALQQERLTWSFLSPEADRRVRTICQDVRVDGYQNRGVEINYIPNDRLSARIIFERADGKPISIEEANALAERIKPQLVSFDQLRKEQIVSTANCAFNLEIAVNQLWVNISSDAGVNSVKPVGQHILYESALTPENRTELWRRIFGVVATRFGAPELFQDDMRSRSLGRLASMRDFYLAHDAQQLASVAAGLTVWFNPSVQNIRQYADIGILNDKQIQQAPGELQRALLEVWGIVRNMPPASYFAQLRERAAGHNLTPIVRQLLQLEVEGGIYHPDLAELASLELRGARRYAHDRITSIAATRVATIDDAKQIVRDYFTDHLPHEYVFTDSTPGITGGFISRRLDCSNHGLTAYEMFDAMGFVAGIESFIATKDGEEVPGIAAHMFNFIDKGDQREYLDYGRPAGQPYSFDSRAPLELIYLNGAKFELKTLTSSTDPAQFAGILVREPVIDDIREFTTAFGKHKGDLAQFLLDEPKMGEVVRRLVRFSAVQDRIFSTSEMSLWTSGTRESIETLYSGWFTKKVEPLATPGAGPEPANP